MGNELDDGLHSVRIAESPGRPLWVAAGASLRHVVRTRTLLTRIEDWQAVATVT